MSKIQILRSLVTERLAAAAEEIFVLFERTLTEYEGEIDRQRKLLHVLTPGMRKDLLPPQFSLCEEEVPSEQQERSPSLDQEVSEPPQIKEEEEEEQKDLWSSQEGEQLQGLEEAEVKWTSTAVPLKREHDEEEPQCSWFNQTQPEESREAEPRPRTSTEHMETQPGGDDWAAPEPARTSRPSGGSELTRDWLWNVFGPETDKGDDTCKESKYSGKGFTKQFNNLVTHMRSHSGDKPFTCSHCGSRFKRKDCLKRHMRTHTGEKPFRCSFCGRGFSDGSNLKTHIRTHSREKPFSCTVCGRGFSHSGTCKRHIRTHSNEKPFKCSVCGKGFAQMGTLKVHMRTHSKEKPFSCSICRKSFRHSGTLTIHMKTHLDEKPFG